MKKLTGFQLKYIALVLMVMDHIHYMFEFTGKVPLWFSQVARISAPLFLFCLVEGFIHTHDRKKYFLKVYVIGAVMGLIQFGFYNVLNPLVRGDGFFPQNAMLSSFTVLMPIMQGIDWLKEKKFVKGILAVGVPLIGIPVMYDMILYPTLSAAGNSNGLFFTSLINMSFIPSHTGIVDGGTITVLGGMALYIFSSCKNKNIRIYAWAIVTLVWYAARFAMFGAPMTAEFLFTQGYDWLEIFAAIPMLCYNGERGKGSGKFFYIFYPAHIYILYALSILVYNAL